MCSLGRRRTCWLDEAVKVNVVCNTSSGVNEGVYEGLEVELLGVGNLESHQLVFSNILALDSYQQQSNIGATASRRLLPLLHSTRDFIESSHQRLEIILERRLWPKRRVDPHHGNLQSSQVIHDAVNTRF